MPTRQSASDPLKVIRPYRDGPKELKGKGAKALQDAIDAGLLEKTTEKVKSGNKTKDVHNIRLTEKGLQAIMDADSPKSVLEAMLPVFQALSHQCGFVLTAAHQALERGKAHTKPEVAPPPNTPNRDAGLFPDDAANLEDDIVAFVNGWAKEKTVGCQFDDLWNHVKQRHQQLTIGAFQDALRNLHNSRRIRLSGWPRMNDDMPKPELALFVSSKVMYYAQPNRT